MKSLKPEKGETVEFEKVTQFAAGLIKKFNQPEGVKVSVLFDSYYLCPVWEDFVDYLNQLPDGNSVVKELRRLIMAS